MYVQNDPVNFIDPEGLAPTGFAVFGRVNYAGKNVNPAAEVPATANKAKAPIPSTPDITKGQAIAASKLGLGVALTAGGVLTENPAMIGAGIPIAADGAVSSLIEFGFGGNTENVPTETLLWIKAIQGLCKENNEQ